MKLEWTKNIEVINGNKMYSYTSSNKDMSFGILHENKFLGGDYILFMNVPFGNYHLQNNRHYTRLDNAKRAANNICKSFYNKFMVTT